jgi:hypothetical protein
VLWADGYRCVLRSCRRPSRTVDHMRPYAYGFRASRWNLAVLCTEHNEVKSNYWRDRQGRVHYRPICERSDPGRREEIVAGRPLRVVAAEITAAEFRAARSPWRLARLYSRRA